MVIFSSRYNIVIRIKLMFLDLVCLTLDFARGTVSAVCTFPIFSHLFVSEFLIVLRSAGAKFSLSHFVAASHSHGGLSYCTL